MRDKFQDPSIPLLRGHHKYMVPYFPYYTHGLVARSVGQLYA